VRVTTAFKQVIDRLEADHEFLLAGERLRSGRDRELDRLQMRVRDRPMRLRPHPYEVTLYFDV
jgi:glutamine synthetase